MAKLRFRLRKLTLGYLHYRARIVSTRLLLRLRGITAECAVCNKWVKPRDTVAQLDNSYCCAACAHNADGFGRFERFRNQLEELGKCLILYAWSQDGMEDNFMSSEGYGYCSQLGNFLLFCDTSGFYSFEEFSTEAEADKEFDRLYSDGMGASEEDGYISDSRDGGYDVSFAGRYIGTFNREARARAAISLEMRKSGFYPDIWSINDHGNITNISSQIW